MIYLIFLIFLLLTIIILVYKITIKIYNNIRFNLCGLHCEKTKIYKHDSPIKIKESYINDLLNFFYTNHKQITNKHVSSNIADYKQLKTLIPDLIKQLESDKFLNYISDILSFKVKLLNGKYKMFSRLYHDKNDYMNWHYDDNITIDDKYTLLIPLLIDNECNTSYLQYMDKQDGSINTLKLKPGELILYNGSEVFHRVTIQKKDNCNRLILIIPLYKTTKMTLINKLIHFMKNNVNFY